MFYPKFSFCPHECAAGKVFHPGEHERSGAAALEFGNLFPL